MYSFTIFQYIIQLWILRIFLLYQALKFIFSYHLIDPVICNVIFFLLSSYKTNYSFIFILTSMQINQMKICPLFFLFTPFWVTISFPYSLKYPLKVVNGQSHALKYKRFDQLLWIVDVQISSLMILIKYNQNKKNQWLHTYDHMINFIINFTSLIQVKIK